jgi:hypothetical protein
LKSLDASDVLLTPRAPWKFAPVRLAFEKEAFDKRAPLKLAKIREAPSKVVLNRRALELN